MGNEIASRGDTLYTSGSRHLVGECLSDDERMTVTPEGRSGIGRQHPKQCSEYQQSGKSSASGVSQAISAESLGLVSGSSGELPDNTFENRLNLERKKEEKEKKQTPRR